MPDAARWSVVVPVKQPAAAKSRLAVDPARRAELAIAIALDTVEAALAAAGVGLVLVVTGAQAEPFSALGAAVVSDEPAAGLNAALRHGLRSAAGHRPGTPLAALAADLAALRPAELAAALGAVPPGQAGFVPDAGGTGTTLLAARSGVPLVPRFGAGSAARHAAAGARSLAEWAGPGLRRDVDTLADLAAAANLGLGRRAAALLAPA